MIIFKMTEYHIYIYIKKIVFFDSFEQFFSFSKITLNFRYK